MLDGPSYAIWTLRSTLESPPPENDEAYNAHITGAAMWILYSGQWLFTEIVHCPREMTPQNEKSWWAGYGGHFGGRVLQSRRRVRGRVVSVEGSRGKREILWMLLSMLRSGR